MFTGVIEEIGSIKEIQNKGIGKRLKISCEKVLEDTQLGDSISTNGVCLTVSEFASNWFYADVMPESLRMSNLKDLSIGDNVNLERALTLNTRLGGHMVSGHIDSVGYVRRYRKEANATWIELQINKEFMKYIIKKGSIALDGVSLTVADVRGDIVMVSIIPTTKDETTLLHKRVGSKINVECDIVGKYIEQLTKKDINSLLGKGVLNNV